MEAETYQAAYDVLTIVARLERILGGVTRSELHLLAYVACLLSIYRRFPAAEWGYGFIRSQWGAPFSSHLERAVDSLSASGLLDVYSEIIMSTPPGQKFVTFLDGISEHQWRTEFLQGACDSALAMSLGAMRGALHYEPGLRGASVHQQPRTLLASGEESALYEQFGAVTEVIGPEVQDLMVPSVVWLTYLNQMQLRPTSSPSGNSVAGFGETWNGE